MAGIAAGAALGGLSATSARAAGPITLGRDPLVWIKTNDNQVLVSCTSVGTSGFYQTVTLFGTTILVKPGGPCPVPPGIGD
jgi:hypothetical protein